MFLRKRRRIQASSFSLYWGKTFSALPERVGFRSIASRKGYPNEEISHPAKDSGNKEYCIQYREVGLRSLYLAEDSRIREFTFRKG